MFDYKYLLPKIREENSTQQIINTESNKKCIHYRQTSTPDRRK